MKSKSHLIIGTLSAVEIALLMGLNITPITASVAAFLSVAPDIDEPNSNVMNALVSKKTTKTIHHFLIFILLLVCFYFYSKTNKNVYIGIVLSLVAIHLIEKRFTANKTRSIILCGVMIFIGLTMMLYNVNPGIVVLTFLISSFPIMNHRSFTHSLTILFVIYVILKYIEITLHIRDLAIIGTCAFGSHLICDIITKRGIPIFYPFSKKYYSIGNLRVGYFLCNVVEIIIIVVLICAIILNFV